VLKLETKGVVGITQRAWRSLLVDTRRKGTRKEKKRVKYEKK
jgi:hypothetical protein